MVRGEWDDGNLAKLDCCLVGEAGDFAEKKDGKGSKLHSQHVLMVTHYSRSCWMLTIFTCLWHKHMSNIFLSMQHTGDSNIETLTFR